MFIVQIMCWYNENGCHDDMIIIWWNAFVEECMLVQASSHEMKCTGISVIFF